MGKIWLTSELATTAGVSIRYVQQEIKSGRLQAEKRGAFWIIPDSAAQKWLNNPRRGTRSKENNAED